MVKIQNIFYLRADQTCLSFNDCDSYWTWHSSIRIQEKEKQILQRYMHIHDKLETLLERRYFLDTGTLKNLRLIYPNSVQAKAELEKPENLELFSDPRNVFTIQIRQKPASSVVTVFKEEDIQVFVVPWQQIPETPHTQISWPRIRAD